MMDGTRLSWPKFLCGGPCIIREHDSARFMTTPDHYPGWVHMWLSGCRYLPTTWQSEWYSKRWIRRNSTASLKKSRCEKWEGRYQRRAQRQIYVSVRGLTGSERPHTKNMTGKHTVGFLVFFFFVFNMRPCAQPKEGETKCLMTLLDLREWCIRPWDHKYAIWFYYYHHNCTEYRWKVGMYNICYIGIGREIFHLLCNGEKFG